MDHYMQFTLPATASWRAPEVSDSFVASQLFVALHRAGAGRGFAVGFPDIRAGNGRAAASLGRRIQVFGGQSDLEAILAHDGVRRVALDNQCDIISPKAIPEGEGMAWRCYYRVRAPEERWMPGRLKRHMRRHPEAGVMDAEDVEAARAEARQAAPAWPYIDYRSRSTGQRFALFIAAETVEGRGCGGFTTLGLARCAGTDGRVLDLHERGGVPVL